MRRVGAWDRGDPRQLCSTIQDGDDVHARDHCSSENACAIRVSVQV